MGHSFTRNGKLGELGCGIVWRLAGTSFLLEGSLVRLLLLLLLLVSFPSSVSDSSADLTPEVELNVSEGILDSSRA